MQRHPAHLRGRPPEGVATQGLVVEGLTVIFDGVKAVADFEMTVAPGEVVGLIGPNGAGKTTVLNAVSRFYKGSAGRIRLHGADVTSLRAHQMARRGVVRTFQSGHPFPAMTVADNVLVASLTRTKSRRQASAVAEQAIEFVGLESVSGRLAGELSFGQKRLLEIARCVALSPTFVLLDEPAAGLNEAEAQRFVATLRRLSGELNIGLVLVEHDVGVVMATCARLYVLDAGSTIARGAPEEVRRDPLVITAFLGSVA